MRIFLTWSQSKTTCWMFNLSFLHPFDRKYRSAAMSLFSHLIERNVTWFFWRSSNRVDISWSESGLWDEDYNKIVLTLFDADLRYWLTMLVLNEYSDSEIRAVSEVFSHVVISNPHFHLQPVFISQRYFVDVSLCWAIYLGMQTEELELGGVGVSQPTSNSYKVSMKMSNLW